MGAGDCVVWSWVAMQKRWLEPRLCLCCWCVPNGPAISCPRSRRSLACEVTLFTPLRYQVTHSDCYPTSVLNALVWLFARDELPGAALQRIYAYCLDGIARGVPGAYTSEHASIALVDWLDKFKTRSFAVTAEVIKGHDVHLRASSGCCAGTVRGRRGSGYPHHRGLATNSGIGRGSRSPDCWDPYIRGARYDTVAARCGSRPTGIHPTSGS